MKHLLILGALLVSAATSHAQEANRIRCPGDNTMEMRYCAGLSLEQSSSKLQRRIPKALLQQWQETTRAVCAHAYTPYKDGSIYPQLVVGCEDSLNRALLKELQPLNNQGDPERTP